METLNETSVFLNDTSFASTDTTPYNSNNVVRAAKNENDKFLFWIGVALSVSSSIFIGASFIIKKRALVRLSREGLRASKGGYGYLKDFMWWAGLLSMTIGEAANFIAYAFAPAALVSTLGVLSVLVSAILSSKYLNEKLNFIGKMGCLLCAIGSTIIVLHAPSDKEIENMEDLQIKITNPLFIFYVNFAVALSVILIYHFRPKYSDSSTMTLLIWIGVCSLIGSLSVMSVKGFGLALVTSLSPGGHNEMTNWLTWFCGVTIIICIFVQMNFLNKALDTFNTAVVTPIYYVFFTTCVIIASAILFREFSFVSGEDWIGLICGFSIVLIAIFLLHFCKQYDITFYNMARQISILVPDEKEDYESSAEEELTLGRHFSETSSLSYGT